MIDLKLMVRALVVVVLFLPLSIYASPSALCKKISKEKGAAAYLVDRELNLSKGPINFGEFKYSFDPSRDSFEIATEYILVITPAKVRPSEGLQNNYLVFKRQKSPCPNTTAYDVSVLRREATSDDPLDAYNLPADIQIPINLDSIPDASGPAGWAIIGYRFDARVVGKMIRAQSR